MQKSEKQISDQQRVQEARQRIQNCLLPGEFLTKPTLKGLLEDCSKFFSLKTGFAYLRNSGLGNNSVS